MELLERLVQVVLRHHRRSMGNDTHSYYDSFIFVSRDFVTQILKARAVYRGS
jgi:hypothetical protein